MRVTGHCYCGAVRYEAEGEPMLQAQCYCRECQYVTGGAPNNFLAMPVSGFRIVAGKTTGFKRTDIPNAVTREFCAVCGTHLVVRPDDWPAVVIKVGTLDDPSVFKPTLAIHTADKLAFQQISPELQQFARLPAH